ncbi:MAG: hypothetical protein AB1916_04690 [Thermodesulfobacteriota bacterium]
MSETQWVVLETFALGDPEALRVKRRWDDIAEDLALLPEANVRLVEDSSGVRLEVSSYVNSYFQGGLGRG